MIAIPETRTLREMVEDRLEAATGEPRHVTDIEINFVPEQDPAANWSAEYKCKPEYLPELDRIVDEVQAAHPVVADWM